MKRLFLLALVAIMAQSAPAQFGNRPINMPFNTLEIQIGFRADFVVNTSYVRRSGHHWLTWSNVGEKYVLRFGVPMKPLTDEWGQTPIRDYDDSQFNWYKTETTDTPNFLYHSHYYDYVVRVYAYVGNKLVRQSQIRYIRQK